MRVCSRLAALALLAALPALPDVVNIQFNQQIGGGSGAIVRCDSCPDGFLDTPTMTSQSSTPTSAVVSASFTDISGRSVTITDTINQDNSFSSTSIGIDVMEEVLFTGVGAEWSAQGDDSDLFTAAFALTTESVLDLTTVQDVAALEYLQLEDSSGNVLNQFPTESSNSSTALTLAPGTYQIVGYEFLDVGSGPTGFTTSNEFTANLSVSADFTAVPEPAWTPALLFVLLGTAVFLRRLLLFHL